VYVVWKSVLILDVLLLAQRALRSISCFQSVNLLAIFLYCDCQGHANRKLSVWKLPVCFDHSLLYTVHSDYAVVHKNGFVTVVKLN